MGVVRIGIFSDSYVPHPDGIAIAVDSMRSSLSDAGHEVFVFCPTRPGVIYDDPHVIAYPSVPALIYDGLRLAQPFGGRKLEEIKKLKLDVIHIQLPFALGFAGMRASKKLDVPLVMSCHQDMDYARDYRGAFLMALLVILPTALIAHRLKDGLKVIFTRRKNKSIARRFDLVHRAYGFLIDQCAQAVAPSQKVLNQLEPYLSKSNFKIVNNCIDTSSLSAKLSKQAARRRLGIADNAQILITTSRLVREKRIELAIRGFAKLAKKNDKAQLYIIGDGPKRPELESLAGELKLTERVHFIGSLEHQAVFSYLAAADIYINACLREIMSLSALEAGAMGLSLLIFDERLVELVDNSEGGYFIKNTKDLAIKAQALLDDPALAKKMGSAARRHILNNYSQERHAAGLANVYKEVIATSGKDKN